MFYNSAKPELSEEQYFVLGEIVQKGNILDIDGRSYLMVEISPMVSDFLKGISLTDRANNLGDKTHTRKLVTPHLHRAVLSEEQGHRLSDMADLYLKEKGRDWTVSSRSNFLRALKLLNEAIGPECPVKTISRDSLVLVRDTILAMPKYYFRKYSYMTMIESVEYARENNLQILSPASINRMMANIKALFRWMYKCEYIDRDPAVNLLLNLSEEEQSLKRKPFSSYELQSIFSAPIFTGCKSEKNSFFIPGPNKPRNARFWVPLIAIFCGMRANEICQLDKSDIQFKDGIACFIIEKSSTTGKRVKSESALRIVPIHHELQKIGFLNFFEKSKLNKGEKLFPELTKSAKGYYSHGLSMWFNDYFLRHVGIIEQNKSFHSLRHNFRDALREAEVPLDIAREIGGWANLTARADTIYGSNYSTKLLKREIDKVKYPNLDVTPLYQD